MSKYLVKYDEWTEISEQTGTIQNIDGGCPIEVSTIQVEGSGVILYPWEMKPFSNVQLYVRGYNKNPLPAEVRVVPFEVGQGGGGGGGSYVLPTATATRLGGVKIGQGITVALDGTISVNGAGIDAWAANTPYPVGIYVTYNDDLYLCTTAHTSGAAFDSAKWKKIGELPIATSSTLGGVKIGNGITVSNDGTISADGIPEWAAATAYSKGVYVTHDNDLYLCMTAHTSTTTFDSSKWKKIGCDGCKIEAWAANTDYETGEYVTYQNNLYLCVNQHTSGSTFDPTKWKLIGGTGSGIEFWAANTEYVAGNYVTYQDDLYLCTTAHTSGSTFDDSKWKLIGGKSGIDAWKTNTDYVLGDYVTYQNKLYLCTTAHTSSTRFAPTKWKEIGELPVATASALGGVKIGNGISVSNDGTISWSGIPAWAAETAYSAGEYVTHQNDLYLCTTAHTSTTTFDGTKWKLIGCDGCKIKEWSADTDYALGDYATYQNSLYLCTTAHTTSATFDSTKWRKIGTDFWKANTDYVFGDYVTYQNNLYLCTTAHTSVASFDATKWAMIGDLPIATASTLGGVKIGAGINVEPDGTISADGGISEWETAKAYAVGNYVTVFNYGRQEWQDDTAYSAGDFVTNGGNLYKCIVSHTAGSIFADDLAANKWVQVPREGGLYICVKAHTSDDFHDDFIVDGKWDAIRNGIDFWSTTKHYEIGQYVTAQDDYKRDEWQANTAYEIGDVVKVYNRGKSEWATGTSYAVGDYATMGKALYRCETAHTSTTFADDVADGDWTLVDTIVEQFSALENHTSGSSFPSDFGAGKWKSKASQMETCICLLEHISDDFAANFAAGKWQAVGGNADESGGGSAAKNPPNLSFSQDTVVVYYEESDTATVTVINNGDGVVDAISHDSDIATASASGNSVTVKCKAKGEADIMAYSTETSTYSPGISRLHVISKEREIGICLVQSGGGAGTWARVDEFGNPLSRDFNASYPWSDMETVTVDGQVMVKVPKYYVKYDTIQSGTYAGKKARLVSKTKQDGYHIHTGFVKNGYVMDCFYIAAFEGYNAGSNKAGSAAGKTPWVNIGGFANAKTYCANRGAGWHLQNIYEIAAVNLLLLIELGTPDVQTAIAQGNVSSSAAQATGATAAVWRGIHEWWGNVWEHVDGLTTDANGIYQIFSNRGDGSYVSTGVANPASGWITEMSEANGTNFDLTDVFLPSATSGTAGNGTYGDYHWTGKSTVLYRSGDWGSVSYGGAFTFNVSAGASVSGSNFGLRLAKEGTLTEEVA